MSFLANSYVNIFPVTNQRADSTAHYLNEPHLVKWLLQLVDKKSFVVSQDATITVDEQSKQYFEFFIDGYHLAVEQRAIEDWIKSNGNPNHIYAFLNTYDDYVLGDNTTTQGDGELIYQPAAALVNGERVLLDNYLLSNLFVNTPGETQGNIKDPKKIKIVLNKNCKYFVNFTGNSDNRIELVYYSNTTGSTTTHQFKSTDGRVVLTGTLDNYLFTVTKIEGSNIPLTSDGSIITLTYYILSTAFLGLDLSTTPEPQSLVQLDSDPLADTNHSTPLRILTKQSDGRYIVPKESKLKFESYSINVDGGEV